MFLGGTRKIGQTRMFSWMYILWIDLSVLAYSLTENDR